METWQPIPGWEELYEASTEGRVRSLGKRVRGRANSTPFRKGRVLSPVIKHSGRVQVTLADGAMRWTAQVGQLVALTFLGPRPEGRVVAHRNDDPTDNRLENLYYATHVENYADSVRNGADRWRTRKLNSLARQRQTT